MSNPHDSTPVIEEAALRLLGGKIPNDLSNFKLFRGAEFELLRALFPDVFERLITDILSKLIRKYNRFFKTINLTNDNFVKTLLHLLTLDDTKPLLLYIDDINDKYRMKFIKSNDDDDEQQFLIDFQKLRESINNNNNNNLKEKCLFVIKYFQLLHHFIDAEKIVQYIYDQSKIHQHLDTSLQYFLNLNNSEYQKFLNNFINECTTNDKNASYYDDNDFVQILKRYYAIMENRKIINKGDLRLLLLDNNLNLLFKYIDDFHKGCPIIFEWKNKQIHSIFVFRNGQKYFCGYDQLKRNAFKNGDSVIVTFIHFIKLFLENNFENLYHCTSIDKTVIKSFKDLINGFKALDSLQVQNLINSILLHLEEKEEEKEEIYDVLFK